MVEMWTEDEIPVAHKFRGQAVDDAQSRIAAKCAAGNNHGNGMVIW